jgi:hypothetical protein
VGFGGGWRVARLRQAIGYPHRSAALMHHVRTCGANAPPAAEPGSSQALARAWHRRVGLRRGDHVGGGGASAEGRLGKVQKRSSWDWGPAVAAAFRCFGAGASTGCKGGGDNNVGETGRTSGQINPRTTRPMLLVHAWGVNTIPEGSRIRT